MAQLARWAKKHTLPKTCLFWKLPATAFKSCAPWPPLERKALVLESCHLGKLKEAHANNDKISAVRIGKAYLAGTAKPVWVPDAKTQERRDWFHAHRKAVKRTTQVRNRLLSYLSDNGVRLKKGTPLAKGQAAENSSAKPGLGLPANGRSSKACSWNCATPTNNAPIGAA
jgi:transposase